MSKLSSNYENPIDNFLIEGVEIISDPLHRMGITPNMVTAASLVLGLGASYALNEHKYEMAALLYGAAYFLDCVDGYIARKYNQVTPFGDWFDHIADAVKVVVLLAVMFKINRTKFWKVMPIMSISSLLMAIHMGCQEKVYGKSEQSVSLSIYRNICPGDPETNIKYTRYMGCGTATLVVILSILYLKP
jgi:phosphatidylglycerophosphate synthase